MERMSGDISVNDNICEELTAEDAEQQDLSSALVGGSCSELFQIKENRSTSEADSEHCPPLNYENAASCEEQSAEGTTGNIGSLPPSGDQIEEPNRNEHYGEGCLGQITTNEDDNLNQEDFSRTENTFDLSVKLNGKTSTEDNMEELSTEFYTKKRFLESAGDEATQKRQRFTENDENYEAMIADPIILNRADMNGQVSEDCAHQMEVVDEIVKAAPECKESSLTELIIPSFDAEDTTGLGSSYLSSTISNTVEHDDGSNNRPRETEVTGEVDKNCELYPKENLLEEEGTELPGTIATNFVPELRGSMVMDVEVEKTSVNAEVAATDQELLLGGTAETVSGTSTADDTNAYGETVVSDPGMFTNGASLGVTGPAEAEGIFQTGEADKNFELYPKENLLQEEEPGTIATHFVPELLASKVMDVEMEEASVDAEVSATELLGSKVMDIEVEKTSDNAEVTATDQELLLGGTDNTVSGTSTADNTNTNSETVVSDPGMFTNGVSLDVTGTGDAEGIFQTGDVLKSTSPDTGSQITSEGPAEGAELPKIYDPFEGVVTDEKDAGVGEGNTEAFSTGNEKNKDGNVEVQSEIAPQYGNKQYRRSDEYNEESGGRHGGYEESNSGNWNDGNSWSGYYGHDWQNRRNDFRAPQGNPPPMRHEPNYGNNYYNQFNGNMPPYGMPPQNFMPPHGYNNMPPSAPGSMMPHGYGAPPYGGMPAAPYYNQWPAGQWAGSDQYYGSMQQDQSSYQEWCNWWQSYQAWYSQYMSGWTQQPQDNSTQVNPTHYQMQGSWSSMNQQFNQDFSQPPPPATPPTSKGSGVSTGKAQTPASSSDSKSSNKSTFAKGPVLNSAANCTPSTAPKLKFSGGLSLSAAQKSRSSTETSKTSSAALPDLQEEEKKDEDDDNNLWIGNLPEGTCAVDVRSLISKYGKVIKCKVGAMKSQKDAGLFALVTMESTKDADVCMLMLQDSCYKGQKILVKKLKQP